MKRRELIGQLSKDHGTYLAAFEKEKKDALERMVRENESAFNNRAIIEMKKSYVANIVIVNLRETKQAFWYMEASEETKEVKEAIEKQIKNAKTNIDGIEIEKLTPEHLIFALWRKEAYDGVIKINNRFLDKLATIDRDTDYNEE